MKFADRIEKLPPYLFAQISKKVAAKKAEGIDVISFGIGDPDLLTFTDAREPNTHNIVNDLSWFKGSHNMKFGTNLRFSRVLDGTTAVLMRNVMAFRVQYGTSMDTLTDALNAWDDPTGTFATLDNANIKRVRALRIGIVVRSPQPEKPNAAGACEATTTLPTLFGAAITPDVANWQCYRYRTAIVIAPMRNIVYGLRT